jgi:hypothetical protein
MNKTLPILISIIFLSCGQKKKPVTGWNYDEPQRDAYYGMKIPDKRNMKAEKPRMIILEPNKREHFINFGMFDTETHWKIYDWLSYHGADSQLPKAVIDTSFKANQQSVINISLLDTGKYMVSFTTIAEGCSFELTIQ